MTPRQSIYKCQYVSGWGKNDITGSSWDTRLQQVMTPIIATEICNQTDWRQGMITDNMICSGYHEGGRSACFGDSGGPLVCYQGDRWVLHGSVTGWGECAVEAKPTVFARVSKFVPWIEKTLAEYD